VDVYVGDDDLQQQQLFGGRAKLYNDYGDRKRDIA